jgi:hypothetical protein
MVPDYDGRQGERVRAICEEDDRRRQVRIGSIAARYGSHVISYHASARIRGRTVQGVYFPKGSFWRRVT